MTFTGQQIRTAYKRLPPDIQDLATSSAAMDFVADAFKEIGLTEDQAILADTEVLNALFCLQSLDEAIGKISEICGKSREQLSGLKSVIQSEILDKYEIDVNDFVQTNKLERVTPASVPEIAPNNLPAVEPGEIVHAVPHVEHPEAPVISSEQQVVREGSVERPPVPPPDYRYPEGKDPYHEPL